MSKPSPIERAIALVERNGLPHITQDGGRWWVITVSSTSLRYMPQRKVPIFLAELDARAANFCRTQNSKETQHG